MADDVAITAGSGTPIATDDCTSAHVPLTKLAYSADGVRTHVPADADGLLVNLGTNNDVTVTSGTITAVTAITNALPAGTNNIGDVDVLTLPGTAAEAAALPGVFVVVAGDDGTDTQPLQLSGTGDLKVTLDSESVAVTGTFWQATQPISAASLPSHDVTNAGTFAVQVSSISAGDNNIGNVDVVTMPGCAGDVAHDTADSGNPVKIGGVAVSGSASPTAVSAADRVRFIANRHGVPYMVGGHPNLITREYDFGTAAQTDVNLAAALVGATERVYVTRFTATCDSANTVAVSVRAGFGTASVPTASATGVSGMIASHPGIAAGSGLVEGNGAGVIAVGGAGEEPRITTSAATTGNLHVVISYYLIDEA